MSHGDSSWGSRSCSSFRSELADKAYLRLEVLSEPVLHALLCVGDQRADVSSGRMPEVHHNVGVNVRDLSVPNAKTFEPALVEQSSCTDAFDLLEDRTSTRVNLQPRVTGATPTQVLLHDSMHRPDVAGREAKSDRQRDLAAFMKNAGVVAKSHVLGANGVPDTMFVEQLGGLEHFRDEHGSFAVGGRGEEMQILPDCTAHCARNSDVMLQSRPAASHRLRDEIAHDHATLAPHAAVFGESQVASGISYHEAS